MKHVLNKSDLLILFKLKVEKGIPPDQAYKEVGKEAKLLNQQIKRKKNKPKDFKKEFEKLKYG